MFLVKDFHENRLQKIMSFVQKEPPLAVIMAAVNFEWTVRRAIIALGRSPNVAIRKALHKSHGLNCYKEIWKAEVKPITNDMLSDIIHNWNSLKHSFAIRNKLVHGIDSCSAQFAQPKVEAILCAANDILAYCYSHNVDLYSKLPVRRKERTCGTPFTQ